MAIIIKPDNAYELDLNDTLDSKAILDSYINIKNYTLRLFWMLIRLYQITTLRLS